jgi:hypothetical protein
MKLAPAVEVASVLMILLFPAEPGLLAGSRGSFNSRDLQDAQGQSQTLDESEVKGYAGKIIKSNGQYVLQDPVSSNAYLLDDQKAAKKYDGKMALVTGILDTKSNTIHVKKIQPAATVGTGSSTGRASNESARFPN